MVMNWGLKNKEEYLLVDKIVNRAIDAKIIDASKKLDMAMDIEACNNNAVELDFVGLAAANIGDLAHDLVGIWMNFNRENGELENCFLPRYAKVN